MQLFEASKKHINLAFEALQFLNFCGHINFNHKVTAVKCYYIADVQFFGFLSKDAN